MYRYNFPERKRQRQIVALKNLRPYASDKGVKTEPYLHELEVLTKAVAAGSQMGVHSKTSNVSRAR